MKNRHGFTLIELLIVLVIVGILAAIAYPSFLGYVVKSRRIEGQAALLQSMQKQERYYSQNNTYVAFSADSAEPDAKRFSWWSGSNAKQSAYELSGQACGDLALTRCIELKATPGTSRVDDSFRDEDCQTLTLDSGGQHGATGAGVKCWP